MVDRSGYKHCTNPTHEKSAVNGRCLTCRNAAMKRWREKKRQGRPRVGQTLEGKPCRNCGGTERYVSSNNCVRCQREHGRRHNGSVIYFYGVSQEFTKWVTSALPEVDSV